MSHMITLFNWSSHGSQKEDKTIQHSQRRCKGELRHINLQLLENTVRAVVCRGIEKVPGSELKFYTTWITPPELHKLVTRYQMHKYNAYCNRKTKCSSGTFVTRCSFKFPHQACENAKLNSVSHSLKSWERFYQLPRGDMEVRVNNTNPSCEYSSKQTLTWNTWPNHP